MKGVPKFDDRGAAYARFALRSGLTRLALMFDPRRKYTGEEVQQLLIAAMLSIDEFLPEAIHDSSNTQSNSQQSITAAALDGYRRPAKHPLGEDPAKPQ